MKQFLIALQFLTILPVRIQVVEEKDFGKSLIYFPLVGAIIGVLLISALFIFGSFLPLVTAALILATSIIITGGVHLDGFADTCDGFFGFKSKEETLRIMRDSRVGTMGVIGVVCLLLLKFAILTGIPKETLWKSLIMMAVFARWTQGLACLISNYARSEGKAKYFIEYAEPKGIIIGGLFTLALFLMLMKLKGLILFIALLALVFLFISYIKRKIGGMTGDTIGATNEIAEILILLSFLQC